LLGGRISSPTPAWISELTAKRPAYLKDHRVQDVVVFPGAAFIEMALAAAAESDPGNRPITAEQISIETPLVFSENKQTRLQLSIGADRRLQIHSLWYDEGVERWTRHATGLLSETLPAHDDPLLDHSILHDRLPDFRDGEQIYRHLEDLGLQYGPQFRILDAAWCDRDEALGRMTPTPETEAEAGRYIVHPTLLDASFQLLAALPSERTYLPTSVERIEVYRPGTCAVWAYARKVSQTSKQIVAKVDLADEDGNIVATVHGLVCKLFEDARQTARSRSRPFLYESVWIDATPATTSRPSFVPAPSKLAPILQEWHDRRNIETRRDKFILEASPALELLTTAYFVDAMTALGFDWRASRTFTAEALCRELGISARHVRLVDRMFEHMAVSGYMERADGCWLVCRAPDLPSAAELWPSAVLAHPDCHAELAVIQRCGSKFAAFLRGEEDPLSAIFPVGSSLAEHLYSDSPMIRPYNRVIADAIVEITRQMPKGETLRILEVGAGTGGLTCGLLPLLSLEQTDYVFTDISHGFLNQAKARFRAFPFVRYEILDLERDIGDQGFTDNSFDLIIASNAVHATADLRTTLTNLRRLLLPDGLLALVEVTAPPRWFDITVGLLPGWWAFTDTDLRPRHAIIPASSWISAAAQCGYVDGAAIGDKIGDKPSLQSVILGRKPGDATQSGVAPAPSLPHDIRLDPRTPLVLLPDTLGVAQQLAAIFESLDFQVVLVEPAYRDFSEQLGLLAQANPDDVDGPTPAPVLVDLRNLTEDNSNTDAHRRPSILATSACVDLQELVVALSGQRWPGKPDLWVVTNGTETVGGTRTIALSQAPVRGFARVAMNEYAELNTYLIDLSPDPRQVEIAALAREILAGGDEDDVALRGNRRFVSRVVTHRNLQDPGTAVFHTIGERQPHGGSLAFVGEAPPPPGPDHVQVRICAAGLNYKDFARQAGLLETDIDDRGLEMAGIVTAVGERVTQWAPGDCVMGIVRNSLSNPITTDPRLLVPKPAEFSFEEAAGIPIVFASAYQALKRQARLAPGESILIHSASGGLGLAAVQVARALGATVFATAGNDEKRMYLRGLGVSYVGDSRSTKFTDEILALTDGQGVDVVLNTLPARMNPHNIRLLKPGGGRLVDLSNLHFDAKLDHGLLKKGGQFASFDLSVLSETDRDYTANLLQDVARLFERGELRPVPYRQVPLERAAEAIYSLRKAAHVGKIVVSMSDSAVDVIPCAGDMTLRPDASYLVAGGLSGFGLALAKWLARQGARHLVLVGRSGDAHPDARAGVAELRAGGVQVEAVAADMAVPEQMASLIAHFGREYPPLRGVVHSAMVLSDGPIRELTRERIETVMVPKVDVAWNLHRLTLDLPLDFFLMQSSISGVYGNRDQANYAAANEYLEALARHRRANGLPALTIAWGVIGSTGYVFRDRTVNQLFNRVGIYELPLEQAWAAIAHGLHTGASNLCAGITDWAMVGQYFVSASSPRFSLLLHGRTDGATTEGSGGARTRIDLGAFATPEERRQHLEEVLIREVSAVLGTDPASLDLTRPLANFGFDSLMAAELIVAIEKATGHGFSRMSLLRQDVTTAELVDQIASVMSGMPSTATDGSRDNMVGELRIEELSDREVEGMLRELATEDARDV
jgi:NADPH:quinone reductase-like Zn-dependent oxidoreductase/SAM-dependent methyltransferase/acyl carrier protein